MGLIPPPIPAAFLLFEVTSGLNFPFWAEQKGSLLGGWMGGSGPLLPPRLNTVDPWVTKQTYIQSLIQSSSWWSTTGVTQMSYQYQSFRRICEHNKLNSSCQTQMQRDIQMQMWGVKSQHKALKVIAVLHAEGDDSEEAECLKQLYFLTFFQKCLHLLQNKMQSGGSWDKLRGRKMIKVEGNKKISF